MDITIWALCASAMTIGMIHTISGPDHYLPLIVFSRARKWNVWQTVGWTSLCAIGHVLGSVVVGLVGVWLGWELSKQEWASGVRGNLSGWTLLLFGFVYLLWGIRKAVRGTTHKHFTVSESGEIYAYKHTHTHACLHSHDETQAPDDNPYYRGSYNAQTRQHHPPRAHAHSHDHTHAHSHDHAHAHAHDHAHEHNHDHAQDHSHSEAAPPVRFHKAVTPWILFVIFVMAPLEPLVPFLFVSGAQRSVVSVVAVVLTFIIAKMLVMVTMVLLGYFGLARFKTQKLERYSSAIAGAVVTFCGIGVVFLGW